MHSRSVSLSDHSGFHLLLIAFACLAMSLFGSLSPTTLADTGGLTRPMGDHAEQIGALNLPDGPTVILDNLLAEDLLDEVVELTELLDDDEVEHCLLRLDAVGFGSPKGRYESSADRSLNPTPFRLRAFSTRGSPLA